MAGRYFKQLFQDRDGNILNLAAIAPFAEDDLTPEQQAELKEFIDKGWVIEVSSPVAREGGQ